MKKKTNDFDSFERQIHRAKKLKKSRSDIIFDIILYTLAVLMIIICVYPVYFIVIASISDPALVGSGKIILWPKGINFKGYEKLFAYDTLWIGYRNTIFYTLLSTIVVLFVNITAGFALSVKNLPGKKWILGYYLIPMFFGGGLVPTYLLVQNLGLTNTVWVMIVPFSVSTGYILVSRTFFNTSIPDDLWDSAQLDGCNSIKYFIKIVLPLSKAILAVIGLWAAVGQWNSYYAALIYLKDENLVPLQLVLRSILINNQARLGEDYAEIRGQVQQLYDLLKYAAIVISTAPIMCLYPFVQKYFNQGVLLGSVKG